MKSGKTESIQTLRISFVYLGPDGGRVSDIMLCKLKDLSEIRALNEQLCEEIELCLNVYKFEGVAVPTCSDFTGKLVKCFDNLSTFNGATVKQMMKSST